MYFNITREDLDYLRKRDKRLGAVIDKIGVIERETDSDLFSSVIHQIIGQQISMKAYATVRARLYDYLGEVTPETVAAADTDALQKLGMSRRKAEYIRDFAVKVQSGEFDLGAVADMSDEDAICALSSLKGIGVWTAEMLLLFCLQRRDILSFSDAGIQRGMRMVYRHRQITREQFEKYRKRLSPCGSVASLYFWAVSGGAIPDLTDPA